MKKNPNFGPDFSSFGPNLGPKIFLWVLPLLDVRHYCKLSLHAISRKSNDQNSRKWGKPHFGPHLGLLGLIRSQKFFFKNLASSATRYHGQLSLCTISQKTNGLILKKLSDRQMGGAMGPKTDRWTRVILQDNVQLMSSIQHLVQKPVFWLYTESFKKLSLSFFLFSLSVFTLE